MTRQAYNVKIGEADFDHLDIGNDFISKNTEVRDDGRIDVNLDSRLAKTLSKLVPEPPDWNRLPPRYQASAPQAHLNIVIQVVGSRGDVQPFIALGCELQKHGHRIRLATHDVFDDFVRKSGLEFYPIGGDPAELMAYMVKNPGLIPSMKSLRAGDIQLKRKMVSEMLSGCWRSCIQPDRLTGDHFVADAIIANPPSFAHVHCAQALRIPVHLMFTMPWTSTRAFPQPLANLKYSSTDSKIANYISYGIVDFMTWQGLGDVINTWRRKTLDLEPVPLTEGPGLLDSLEIPFTYCWSPALVPKPIEWGAHIDVCGFFFREAPEYSPSPELDEFLNSGSTPIYIGFGSIVIDNPTYMTQIILDSIHLSGARAVISRGWSKLGGENTPNVFYLDDCPHEWLFKQVSAVVHHGGAGTTACGLLNGKPTTIVPFFGDQPFWGNMVAAAGAGPKPIPQKKLTAENLARAISYSLTPEASQAAAGIATQMKSESGVKAAVKSFHDNLSRIDLHCDLIPLQAAAWTTGNGKRQWKLSKIAASTLIKEGRLKQQSLQLYESNPIYIETHRWDPATATVSASVKTLTNVVDATVGIVRRPMEEYQRSHAERQDAGNVKPTSRSISHSSLSSNERNQNQASPRTDRESVVLEDCQTTDNKKGLHIAGAMALASAGSLGKVFISSTKGVLIDIPLAMADGLNSLPQYYDRNDKPRPIVTNFQSGVKQAGNSFGHGIYEGFTDVFRYTWNGKKEEGAKGVAKGLSKGLVSFTAKVGGAVVGLVAYPGQGVERSVRGLAMGGLLKEVTLAKKNEGEWLLSTGKISGIDVKGLVARFGTP